MGGVGAQTGLEGLRWWHEPMSLPRVEQFKGFQKAGERRVIHRHVQCSV